MKTSAAQIRAWTGPAVLSFGFRPFFLLAAIWAAVAMVLWIGMLSGGVQLPTAFDPVSWHAHAFIFGYLVAVVAGFLLTAVPNWTGRLPVVGWRLAFLAGLWVAGRLAVTFSQYLPPIVVFLIDLSCMTSLAIMLAREIIAGRNWKNLIVLALVVFLIIGGAIFHWEAARGGTPSQGIGLRIGLAAGIMMISVIGGRIVPSFTRNWLVKRSDPSRPIPPMQRFDKSVLLLSLAGLSLWVARPLDALTAFALIFVGLAQFARLSRWSGHRTTSEPLVWVLHLAYAFVPLGALALGASILRPDLVAPGSAQHLWMAGAIGMMTLAVMTRATLGHTGRALTAGGATTGVYLALFGAVFARVAAGIWSVSAFELYSISAALWCLAFIGFALVYGPLLMTPKNKVS
ncbi:NnrS family protein [Thalassovita taeanensis]|uniref:Uncharacterized protein involved in response to NO n=1 Tax=Thalassovita taeanensis TaxID=657014 RepID=A0A1H9GEN9_9RHOB|nr:NnrS family protein [Thalassovita taeanensis]SEQ48519.1 uncharacterized protein involved in response to NO [Thalassovita taeanensis]